MALLDFFFPPLCFGCQQYDKNYLCPDCWLKLEINNCFYCPVCQNRLPYNKKVCHKDSLYRLASAVDYRQPSVQKIIQDFKYNFLTSALVPIRTILDEYLSNFDQEFFKNYSIIPIPLAKQRLRERGFNQAELIAQHVAGRLNLILVKNSLIRVKDTPKQSEAKDWQQRLSNIKNCFIVNQPELIKNKNIILVDDVFTSGATLNEAALVLKAAGAKNLIALTIARAR